MVRSVFVHELWGKLPFSVYASIIVLSSANLTSLITPRGRCIETRSMAFVELIPLTICMTTLWIITSGVVWIAGRGEDVFDTRSEGFLSQIIAMYVVYSCFADRLPWASC